MYSQTLGRQSLMGPSMSDSSFLVPNFITKFERDHRERCRQTRDRGEGIISSFLSLSPNISKTVPNTAKVTISFSMIHPCDEQTDGRAIAYTRYSAVCVTCIFAHKRETILMATE